MSYNLLKHQLEFLQSDAIHTGLVGGFRSGKTFIGVLKTVAKKMEYPNINVAYYLPNYPLIRDVAVPYFEEVLERQNIPFNFNSTDKTFYTDLGNIYLRSMHQPEFIIAYEVGYSLVDEADVLPKKKMEIAYKKILSRNSVRLPDGKSNSTDFVSTPEGFRFLYDFFVTNDNDSKRLIRARTGDNPYISNSYIDTLKSEYSEEELLAYLNGEFVNLTAGSVYHSFDRELNHSDRMLLDSDHTLHIGMDFNITNMSAVVRVIDNKYGLLISTAVDEITGAYDTAEMINLIKERYAGKRIIVYPDASGGNRNTSASDTDIDLLRKAKFRVQVGKSNPSVRDRVTAVNSSFRNAKGEVVNFINTKLCPSLAESYEMLPYDKNGVPDKTTGFDHITDADGYVVYSLHFKPRPRAGVMGTGGNRL